MSKRDGGAARIATKGEISFVEMICNLLCTALYLLKLNGCNTADAKRGLCEIINSCIKSVEDEEEGKA